MVGATGMGGGEERGGDKVHGRGTRNTLEISSSMKFLYVVDHEPMWQPRIVNISKKINTGV